MQAGNEEELLAKILEDGRLEEAEDIIASASYGSDVLSRGKVAPIMLLLNRRLKNHARPLNLKLSRLLIEKGTDQHREHVHPTGEIVTVLSGLVDLYMNLHETELATNIMPCIGMNGEVDLTCEQVSQQLLQLMDMSLGNGANPNAFVDMYLKNLMHVILEKQLPHIEVVDKLCTAGSDINQCNIFGTSPLMSLMRCRNPHKVTTMFRFFDDRSMVLDWHQRDASGRTVLWEALFMGMPKLALNLCKRGVGIETPAMINRIPCNDGNWPQPLICGVSPLFAPLLGNSPALAQARYAITTHQEEGRTSCWRLQADRCIHSVLSPLVDAGHFNGIFIQRQVQFWIRQGTNFRHLGLLENEHLGRSLVPLMFGNLVVNLKHTCVRAILRQVCFSGDNATWDKVRLLTPAVIASLLEELCLPVHAMKTAFEMEAAKLQVLAAVSDHGGCEVERDLY